MARNPAWAPFILPGVPFHTQDNPSASMALACSWSGRHQLLDQRLVHIIDQSAQELQLKHFTRPYSGHRRQWSSMGYAFGATLLNQIIPGTTVYILHNCSQLGTFGARRSPVCSSGIDSCSKRFTAPATPITSAARSGLQLNHNRQ